LSRALILFAHGSRDPRWAQPFLRLQEILRVQLPDVVVELAFLELMEPRLPALVERLAGEGVDAVSVVPVFLGQGGHVLRDLPALVGDARAQHPAMRIVLAEAVGENQAVLQAIATYCANSSDL
jgi:sirohydrochlorin cobaltochelatase